MIPDVIDDVTIDGKVYGMPVNIHRENTLLYNKQIFDDNGLEPPTTVEEFLTVCDKLKAAGVTPVATAYQGWIPPHHVQLARDGIDGSQGVPRLHDGCCSDSIAFPY
ncbi:MAG: ABC transporter substrate-binding protein [Polyangiaceae bacterium]